MIAEELMTEDPMTVDANARVRDAIEILQTLDIRHLPVLDKRGGLVGVLSDRDLRHGDVPYTLQGGALLDAPVVGVMSTNVVTVEPDTDIREVIDLMLEHKIGALPVVESATGDLVGIVSYVDVLRGLRDGLE